MSTRRRRQTRHASIGNRFVYPPFEHNRDVARRRAHRRNVDRYAVLAASSRRVAAGADEVRRFFEGLAAAVLTAHQEAIEDERQLKIEAFGFDRPELAEAEA